MKRTTRWTGRVKARRMKRRMRHRMRRMMRPRMRTTRAQQGNKQMVERRCMRVLSLRYAPTQLMQCEASRGRSLGQAPDWTWKLRP
ncbi:unnamed protein product [Polarella glacialis]|uniref:Uncharacterized protein n=1 Tax=Polarella glacialis TaxID=89957 RepID=A0A813KQY9_POLGL|nr:unnamed protein product [Polarella glacialis]